jgi:hypothetical protein
MYSENTSIVDFVVARTSEYSFIYLSYIDYYTPKQSVTDYSATNLDTILLH